MYLLHDRAPHFPYFSERLLFDVTDLGRLRVVPNFGDSGGKRTRAGKWASARRGAENFFFFSLASVIIYRVQHGTLIHRDYFMVGGRVRFLFTSCGESQTNERVFD